MNRKGFTLIELVTTFALSTVIIIILINIVLVIRNIYTKYELKSNLLIEQSNLSSLINKKFTTDSLVSYIPCSESSFCYTFTFKDNTKSTLVVSEDYIKFDNYVYTLESGTTVEDPTMEIITVDVSNDTTNNSFLVIKIPIKNKLYSNEDFGFNIVYQYNSKKITL